MGAEILRQVLEDEKSAHLLVTEAAPEVPEDLSPTEPDDRGRLTRREWFYANVVFFLIGTWNLFIVNLARTPDRWWFWLPVALWAMGLVIYGAWAAWRARRTHPHVAGARGTGLRRPT